MEFDFTKIDWKLLRKQKLTIVKMAINPDKFNLSKKQQDDIDGILNLLDSIQDHAADDLNIQGVFPKRLQNNS